MFLKALIRGEFKVTGACCTGLSGDFEPIVVARKLEHHYPHGLKVKYKGS